MIPYSQAKTANMESSGGGISDIMQGATNTADGKAGAAPKPLAGQNSLFLRGDGQWAEAQGPQGTGITGIKVNADYTLTISLSDGSEYTTPNMRGPQGPQGEQGVQGIQGEQGIQGVQGEQGIQGVQGETGNGIESIEKTSSTGDRDTYTITFTDGAETTYTVTNGSYKESVTKGFLYSNGWNENKYSFEETYPLNEYNIEIEPDGDRITVSQYDAWSNAKIVGSATSNSCIAVGDVPNINIPIVIKAVALDVVS